MRNILFLLIWLFMMMQAQALTVFDPSNYAQNLLTASRTLQALEQQARQLANEAQMLLNMEKNLKPLGSTIIEPLNKTLQELQGTLSRAGDLAFRMEQAEETYARLFPDSYQKALRMNKVVQTAKERWEHRVKTFRVSLTLQGQLLEALEQDRTELTGLLAKSKKAEGARSAIQAGNELLALNIKQLMQLQTLMALQARSNTLAQAERAANQKEAQKYFESFMGRWGQ